MRHKKVIFFLPLGLNLSLADSADGYPQPLLGSEAPPEMRAPERIYAGGSHGPDPWITESVDMGSSIF